MAIVLDFFNNQAINLILILNRGINSIFIENAINVRLFIFKI